MPRKSDTPAVPPASAAPSAAAAKSTAPVDGQPTAAPAQRRIAQALEQYECGPVRFSGDENASYERHLVYDNVVAPEEASPSDAGAAPSQADRRWRC